VPKAFSALVAAVLLAALAVYRWLVSPVLTALGARCRFHPTCSQYAVGAIRHFGPWRGSWLALKRLGRCHPFHPGGFDPPVPTDTIHHE
jgi:putative membrane protein insertion efficiency factor